MDSNSSNSLDLYAKVEDLLGVKEVSPRLYAHYLLFLQSTQYSSLLDVGCGSGDFLSQMTKALNIPKAKGIDLSPTMVEYAKEKGVDASCVDLCLVDEKYELVTAVFDMLNYLNRDELKVFLKCVVDILEDGGLFLCDINTLYGFENVAVGSFIVDDNDRFLTVDSDFEGGKYSSEFTLFEKDSKNFKKSQETIYQYYHSVEEIVRLSGLELVVNDSVDLYEFDEADKRFLVLRRV